MTKLPLLFVCALTTVGSLAAQTATPAPSVPVVTSQQKEEILKRSLVSSGDTARLSRVLAKAARGEKIVVGVIGGSITQGAKATKPEKRYGNVLAQWWRDQFPKAEIALVNAGIGATGSNYGSLRVERDLLSKNPDFVVVEYSCNDPDVQQSAVTLEGLVRQILQAPGAPAVVMLFMTKSDGSNAQQWHSKVGEHYHLPMVSFRDAIWAVCKSGELKIEDFLADQVHPNDFGHGITAECIAHLLGQVPKESGADRTTDTLPAPLFSKDYESTTLKEAGDLTPISNQGWTSQIVGKDKVWHAEEPGSTIEFEISGADILFMSHVIRGAQGKAEVQVDDLPPKTIDGWFSGTWGGYRMTTVLADGLDASKPHHVRVKVLEDKDAESTGHGFSIFGLGAAGVH